VWSLKEWAIAISPTICPDWLECGNINWGPKSFRFNNCCLEHEHFKGFVEECWKSFSVNGRKAHALKEKLKMLFGEWY
jgi:hypothetical protein